MTRNREFNAERSSKTKYVETRRDAVAIYSHTAKHVAGKFLVVKGPNDWAATETLEQARTLKLK